MQGHPRDFPGVLAESDLKNTLKLFWTLIRLSSVDVSKELLSLLEVKKAPLIGDIIQKLIAPGSATAVLRAAPSQIKPPLKE
jgi:hypothetical protein